MSRKKIVLVGSFDDVDLFPVKGGSRGKSPQKPPKFNSAEEKVTKKNDVLKTLAALDTEKKKIRKLASRRQARIGKQSLTT